MIYSKCCNARIDYRKAKLDEESVNNGEVPWYAPYCPTCGDDCDTKSTGEIFNNK